MRKVWVQAGDHSEFAPSRHAALLVETPFVQVRDERGKAVIVERQERAIAFEAEQVTLTLPHSFRPSLNREGRGRI